MNGLVLLIISVVFLAGAYKIYGDWLMKKWGVGEGGETPSHTVDDGGIDYVPAKVPVLLGHHFSSIAGAGPITGPINASGFGWLPCTLWILLGGVFFGGVHDLGSLFASVRHNGNSIGEVINKNMSKRAKMLFLIFAFLTLILVVAAFASIVAGTFGVGATDEITQDNATVATVSLLFIALAIVFGILVYRRNAPIGVSSIIGVVGIAAVIAIGMNFHPIYLSSNTWLLIIAIYIAIASVTPVWILLQPRDYLTSFLLYAMMIIAIFAVIIGRPGMDGLPVAQATYNGSPLFPVLFTTIACGAISGFHSTIASGTTAKQLDKEKDAKPIAYGGMLIECVLAILTLIAVAYARKHNVAGTAGQLFGGGLAHMIDDKIPGTYNIIYTLLVLTYSSFCLTSLDTACRLARFMFQEMWIDSTKGETPQNVTGYKKFFSNLYVSTIISVVFGITLGATGYEKIWALFGSANQLLAGLALMGVAAWLGNVAKSNKMVLFPMVFMLIVTICSLFVNTANQIKLITSGEADWGPYAQTVIGIALIILALVLTFEGITVFNKQRKGEKTGAFAKTA